MKAIMKVEMNRRWLTGLIILLLSICATVYFSLKFPRQHKSIKPKLIKKNSSYFLPITIKGFSSANIPYTTVSIENQTVIVQIDLGYAGYFALPSQVINNLNKKKFLGKEASYGIKGKDREYCIYEVEKISTESISFCPMLADELTEEIQDDMHLGGERSKDDTGIVGWRLFERFNLLVDCKNSIIALCDGLEMLKKRGYPVELFTCVPLLLDQRWVEFEAETEEGLLRCVLDTGCTYNLLNKDPQDPSNSHMIINPNNRDEYLRLNPENKNLLVFDHKDTKELSIFNIGSEPFGPMTFDRIKSPMPVEAILGMEFFENTLVFIDFENQKIYFYAYSEKKDVSID
jgi:hypothetical protein